MMTSNFRTESYDDKQLQYWNPHDGKTTSVLKSYDGKQLQY